MTGSLIFSFLWSWMILALALYLAVNYQRRPHFVLAVGILVTVASAALSVLTGNTAYSLGVVAYLFGILVIQIRRRILSRQG